jgi:hypothetical protein
MDFTSRVIEIAPEAGQITWMVETVCYDHTLLKVKVSNADNVSDVQR